MRIRLRYTKLGKVRWTSHRDIARIWERAVRRVQLPVAYSEGFSPRPKLSFGLALSTGHESVAEYLDVSLRPDDPVDLSTLPARLTAALPEGIDAVAAVELDSPVDSLQHAVTSCTWRIQVPALTPAQAEARCQELLAADEVLLARERKGRTVTDDLRPSVVALEVAGPAGEGVELIAELATQPRGLKPSELLSALAPDLVEGPVRRTHQWIAHPDAKREPIAVPADASLPTAVGVSA